jgi:hypothetical protein
MSEYEIDINYTPVRSTDKVPVFLKGKAFDVASGCKGCVVFSESELVQGLFEEKAAARQDPRVSRNIPKPTLRALSEGIIGLAQKRGIAGMNGTCQFIEKVSDCWRRDPVVRKGPDFDQGVEYAYDSDERRDLAKTFGRVAAREEMVSADLAARAGEAISTREKEDLLRRSNTFANAAYISRQAETKNMNVF